MFNTFDEYLEFCTLLVNNRYIFLKNTSLYLYKSKYYLCFHVEEKNINSFKAMHYTFTEFATHIANPDLFERKLKEYGKEIFTTTAINNCVKHFGNV